MARVLKLGMVGGGQGAFIGGVHRMVARLDGHWQLVAGALSADAGRAHASAAELGIAPERSYASFTAMAQAEAARDDGIDAVAIVTPNHLHAPAAEAFLRAGIDVICDKPVTASLAEAEALAQTVEASGRVFVLTHNYTGYPLVRHARQMVADGAIGDLRVVQGEYAQDWLTEKAEAAGLKQAEWRTDPARSGAGGSIGDIGTHAYNLAAFVTGQMPARLSADLTSFVEGRRLDDNAHILLRYASGAKGMIWASQVAPGNENGLKLRVYGTRGGLEWAQENPNVLHYTPFGAAPQVLTRGGPAMSDAANAVTRIPPGHPEGYLEAFATLYSEAAELVRARQDGTPPRAGILAPGMADGLAGMRFIDACVRSSTADAGWVSV